MSGDPDFTSATETPEKLLERVRRRLKAAEPPEPVPDVSAGAPDLISGEGLLEGWYPPERFAGDAVRWTQQRFTFRANADGATHLLLEACLFPESGLPETLARVRAGEETGPPVRVRPGWNRLLFALPATATPAASFAVDAGGSWCPADSGLSGDDRELGLLVRRLELVRLAPLPRFGGLAPPAVAAPAAPAARALTGGGPLSRVAARFRRMLVGRALTESIERHAAEVARLSSALDGLGALAAEQARLLDQAMAAIEETMQALMAEDERIRREASTALRESREELSRKIRHLLETPGPR